MKRSKRKALLKLLRTRPITGNFYSVAITPEIAAKLGTREWENHILRQSDKSGIQRNFINAELRNALKAIDKDAEFNFYWPLGVAQHDLCDIPSDLTITFAKCTDLSEAVRKMARKWLEDIISATHPQLRDNGRKNPLVLGSLDGLLGEHSHRRQAVSVRQFNSDGNAIKDSVLDWKHPLMDQTLRLSAPVPKPEVEPETMANFVARATRTLKHINPATHQAAPAGDSTMLSDFFDKEHMALVQEAIMEFGLAKALEYRSMPAKPADYSEYCARSALNELENDDEA